MRILSLFFISVLLSFSLILNGYSQQPVVQSEGYLTALANHNYTGWHRIAKSAIGPIYGGIRGGVKVTLTATGGYLGPSMQIIHAYKDWHMHGLVGSVQDFIGYSYFIKFRLVTDNEYAYIEGYAGGFSISGASSFNVLVESLGYVQNNWTAYNENLTPGIINPISVSELAKINNGLAVSNLSVAGSIGIGTTSPIRTLDVHGYISSTDGVSRTELVNGGGVGYVGTQSSHPLGLQTNNTEQVRIMVNGNVGIGTINPTERLSVNGNVKAKKLIVTQTGWPDYVFAPQYELKPLSVVESFIKKYKHLPDIPSEKEVAEQGLDVGQTEALLLKKIEEFSLYLIALNKKIEKQEKQIQLLQREIVRAKKKRS